MRFFYENNDLSIPNGPPNLCKISELDISYGFKNAIFELNHEDEIIWNFTSNNVELLNLFYGDNYAFFENVFQIISKYENVKLVFSSLHEGNNIEFFYQKLKELKENYQVKKNQIYVITVNLFGGYGDDFNLILKPFLLFDLSKNYNSILKNEHFIDNNLVELSDTNSYLLTKKDKFFLSYNKNVTRTPRINFFLWLLKSKLIDDTLYSLLIKDNIDKENIDSKIFDYDLDEIFDLRDYIDEFNNLEYRRLDWDYGDGNSHPFESTKYTTKSHYDSTLFTIVTETSFNYNSNNITEKTFKPIANCHPFIIFGDNGIFWTLKNLGFELYEDLIDYSFDDVWDNRIRFNMICKEIKKIHSMGEDGLKEWYIKNIDKIKRNRDLFLKFSEKDLIKETLNELKMKKVLITGASGLVGTHLVKKCIDEGYYVISCDMREPLISIDSYYHKHYNIDLTNEVDLKNLFLYEKPDAVFNCFGVKGSPIRAKEKPVDFLYPSFKINTEIINQCAINNIWLVFVSSVGVYSPSEKFVEDDVWKTLPSNSDWFPSWSKRMGELLLEAYKVQHSYTNWAVIRPANIFGEYDDYSGTGTVISSTIKKVHESKGEIDCWGDGSPIRDFVYAGDVADAILKIYKEKRNELIINFGSGLEVTIKELIDMVIKISEKDIKVNWDTSKPNGDLRRLMDVTKQKEFNLLPKTTIEDALKITYNYYKSFIS